MVAWKIAPVLTSASRSSLALTRLPLWPTASCPWTLSIDDRLGVGQPALARRRVAHVAHRQMSRQLGQRVAVEDVVHIAHRLRHADLRAVGGGDAGALLPAVLQRIEPEVREIRRLGMPEDPEDAALIVEFVAASVAVL